MQRSVLVVDDNAEIRKSVKDVLDSDPVFHVCGEATNGAEAIERAIALQPQVIILDLQMPVMNGLEAAPILVERVPKACIILFTMFGNREVENVAKKKGIHAVVSKDDPLQLLSVAHSLFPPKLSKRASPAH